MKELNVIRLFCSKRHLATQSAPQKKIFYTFTACVETLGVQNKFLFSSANQFHWK